MSPRISVLHSLAMALPLAVPALADAAERTDTPTTLDAIQVRSTARSYVESNTTSATGTDTPLIEIPHAVRVVSPKLIEDLNATSLADTVDYVSGVTRMNTFGGTWDNYAIRGFSNADGGSLLNGLLSARGYGPQRDMASVERLEFLKGPSAALYGSGEPGGSYNIVTKKPLRTAANRVTLQGGNLGYARTTLDSTGPLGESMAYRINLAAEQGASRSRLLDSHKHVLAPALSWNINDTTRLQYESEFIRVRTPLDRGLIHVNGKLGLLPRDRVLAEPGDPDLHVTGDSHQLRLEQELSAKWTLRAGASHRETDLRGFSADLIGTLSADGRTLSRRNSWRSLPSRDSTLQIQVEGQLSTGALKHRVLAGAEGSRLFNGMDLAYSTLATAPYPIDIYEPVYGQPHPALTLTTSTDDLQRSTGVFVQDQLSLGDHWRALAGVRLDRIKQEVRNNFAGSSQRQQHSEASPRIGLLYLLTDRMSFYTNASTAFRPNIGTDVQGKAFDPQQSKAFEVGGKWALPGDRLSINFAVFDIRKRNVLTRNPTNPAFSIAAGEVRSRGAEMDLSGQVGENWRLTGNSSFLDTEVLQDNNTALIGKRLMNIPRLSGSLFAIREGTLANGSYGVGGGVTYVGERTGNATDSYRLPAYTTARLTAYWRPLPKLKLTADVHNLTNREYYTASWGALTVVPGLGRQLVLGAQLDL